MGASSADVATVVAGGSTSMLLFLVFIFIIVGFLGLLAYWLLTLFEGSKAKKKSVTLTVTRADENPIISPNKEKWWESEAVFNPAAIVHNGKVHLFYRAMGKDGISRIGYAASSDGIHFDERSDAPIYDWGNGFEPEKNNRRFRPLSYNTDLYASGGGWGGCEDPRAVVIEDTVYMSFGIFNSWQSMRLAVATLSLDDLEAQMWQWTPHIPMSPHNETHKNWVLFPEKINGKFAILHGLTPSPQIEYVPSLEDLRDDPIKSNNHRAGRKGKWDAFVRGAGAPPLKTPYGWLLFYHGMDPESSSIGYNIGVMLLDLQDPSEILYRSEEPVLKPEEWYENDWKPGVVYACGAVVFKDELLLYYGGGDKYIAVAKANYKNFIEQIRLGKEAKFTGVKVY